MFPSLRKKGRIACVQNIFDVSSALKQRVQALLELVVMPGARFQMTVWQA